MPPLLLTQMRISRSLRRPLTRPIRSIQRPLPSLMIIIPRWLTTTDRVCNSIVNTMKALQDYKQSAQKPNSAPRRFSSNLSSLPTLLTTTRASSSNPTPPHHQHPPGMKTPLKRKRASKTSNMPAVSNSHASASRPKSTLPFRGTKLPRPVKQMYSTTMTITFPKQITKLRRAS